MKRTSSILLTTLGVILSLVACKVAPKRDQQGAQVKSLDDLAHTPGAKGPDYRCGGLYEGGTLPDYVEPLRDLIEPADSDLRNTLLGTAQALPAPVAQLITGTRTRIRLVADAVNECAGTPFTAAEQGVSGTAGPVKACWRQKAAGERPELILQADKAVIERSLVRLGAYLFSEFLMTRVTDANAPAPFNAPAWQAAAKSFLRARTAIARALLDDLKNFDDETAAKFERMNAADAAAFGNVAIAEAQDSYYCSADSRRAFASLFRKTYGVFANEKDPGSMIALFGPR